MKDLSDKAREKEKRSRLLGKLAQLESIERRWISTLIASIVLGFTMTILLFIRLDIAGLVKVQLPATQFIILLVSAAIITILNLLAFIQYFAFSLSVERAVTVKKIRSDDDDGNEDEDQ